MRRRTFAAALLAGLAGGAGCVETVETPTGTPDGTTVPGTANDTVTVSPSPEAARIADQSFERTGDCEAGGTASASFDAAARAVRITGCITGRNGCAEAALGRVAYNADATEIRVQVGAPTDPPPGTACTQALVSRGYVATFTFEPRLPRRLTVTVSHSGPDDGEVASTTRLAGDSTPRTTPVAVTDTSPEEP